LTCYLGTAHVACRRRPERPRHRAGKPSRVTSRNLLGPVSRSAICALHSIASTAVRDSERGETLLPPPAAGEAPAVSPDASGTEPAEQGGPMGERPLAARRLPAASHAESAEVARGWHRSPEGKNDDPRTHWSHIPQSAILFPHPRASAACSTRTETGPSRSHVHRKEY